MYTTYVSVSARISSVRRVSSRIFTKNYKIVKHAMTFRSIRVLNSNSSLFLSPPLPHISPPFRVGPDSGRSVEPSFLRICPIFGEMTPGRCREHEDSPMCSPTLYATHYYRYFPRLDSTELFVDAGSRLSRATNVSKLSTFASFMRFGRKNLQHSDIVLKNRYKLDVNGSLVWKIE